jgi:hypothetical protein
MWATLVRSGDVFLQVAAAARIADCHPKTIRRLIKQGKLRNYSLASDPRVRLGDLIAYLAGSSDAVSAEEIRRRARAAVGAA